MIQPQHINGAGSQGARLGCDQATATGAASVGSGAGPAFPSGRGRAETHALHLSDGRPNSAPRAGLSYDVVTAPDIARMAADPPSLPKDEATWFIPSTYADHDARSHAAQTEKGRFAWLVLDVDKGNPDRTTVADAVRAVCGAARFILYATRSATAQDRRWRVLVPLAELIHGRDYADTQAAFFETLRVASGGVLIPDHSLAKTGQLVFLPNRGEFYEYEVVQGPALSLGPDHPINLVRERMRQQRAAVEAEARAERDRKAAQRAAQAGGDGSIIERFNAAHTVGQLLGRYGYHPAGNDLDWRSPMQTSGSYATRDFGELWISLSDSDAAAEIGAPTKNGHRHGDAFDLFRHFEHDGDFKAAVKAYAAEIDPPRAGGAEEWWTASGEAARQGGAGAGECADPPPEGDGAGGAAERSRRPKPAFELVPISEFEMREPDWLVEDVIEAGALGQIFGDPGCGKSFVALDLAFSIATGRPFHGRKTKTGAVIYLAGEGHNGLARRRAAWERHTGQTLEMAPLYVSRVAAQFLDGASAAAVAEAVDARAAEVGPIALIVIDTLARNFGPGSENDTADMSAFVAAVDELKARHGAAALIVHHTGHGEKSRGRGSMALLGALDAEFRIDKEKDRIRMTCTKMKDFAEPPPMGFRFVPVDLGLDADGDEITSAVLEAAEPLAGGRKPLSASLKRALESFYEARRRLGREMDPNAEVHVEEWRPVFYESCTADTPANKRKAFQRAREGLVARGEMTVKDDRYRRIWTNGNADDGA